MADAKKITKKAPTKADPKVQKTTRVTAGKESTKSTELTAVVVGITGKSAGNITLPKEIFGAKVNPQLMSQAVRVYLANQRQGNAATKTRGEINMTTAKWYRQKGTGRARHGAKSAPIFVKGGVAHGPQPV